VPWGQSPRPAAMTVCAMSRYDACDLLAEPRLGVFSRFHVLIQFCRAVRDGRHLLMEMTVPS
jgi:hypothetical protein